jgi:hypothetical protein
MYEPLPPPSNEPLALYILREFQRLSEVVNMLLAGQGYAILYAEPAKPREGQIVIADGTTWNPGAGKGVYAFLSGSWSKL